ncbi:hypothetical protein B0A50_02114 [Salinomyces thailandicus]|uniref:non-specific serine/threonine protein kinase n=1 Tax=Salinomyces thailandicus TaxID=706561 RepID=A0A4U0UA44_9PEZI|nr:hypothetical protein B0A50_02114 [Salinomyces thailandica]
MRRTTSSNRRSASPLQHLRSSGDLDTGDLDTGLGGDYDTFSGFSGVHLGAYHNSDHSSSPFVSSQSLSGSPIDTIVDAYNLSNARPGTANTASTTHETIHYFNETGEGQAKVIERTTTGELVVVKTIRLDYDATYDDTLDLPNEVNMLSHHIRPHPNIVELQKFRVETTANGALLGKLYLTHCNGGDLQTLHTHLASLSRPAPPLLILHFIASLADALAHLHLGLPPSNPHSTNPSPPNLAHTPILHNDIKLSNILLHWPSPPHPKPPNLPQIILADFGFSDPQPQTRGICGTPYVYPPEIRAIATLERSNHRAYLRAANQPVLTPASDIYTTGAALYELATGRVFDCEAISGSEPKKLTADFGKMGWEGEMGFVRGLAQAMLIEAPQARITTEEVYEVGGLCKGKVGEMIGDGVEVPGWVFPAAQTRETLGGGKGKGGRGMI